MDSGPVLPIKLVFLNVPLNSTEILQLGFVNLAITNVKNALDLLNPNATYVSHFQNFIC
jgi:hypothetical protein